MRLRAADLGPMNMGASDDRFIFVFHGVDAKFAAGVFESLHDAKRSIATHKMSGMLTRYSMNETAYDYAIRSEFFLPKPTQSESFVQKFTSASQEHYHFQNGEIEA